MFDERTARLHMRMVFRVIERDDRRETGIGSFEQFTPFVLRFRGEQIRKILGVAVPFRGIHLRFPQVIGRIGTLKQFGIELRLDGAHADFLAILAGIAAVEMRRPAQQARADETLSLIRRGDENVRKQSYYQRIEQMQQQPIFKHLKKLFDVSTSWETLSPAAIDINGDGVPDLVLGNEDGQNHIYLGDPSKPGTFANDPIKFGAPGDVTTDVKVIDVDGDGDVGFSDLILVLSNYR